MNGFLRAKGLLCFLLIATGLLATAQSGPGPEQDQAPSSGSDSTIRVNVDLVNIFYTVRTKKGGGQLVPNLEQNDFQIFEDGKQQTVKQFTRESDLPLTLGLLIDISASQQNLIEIERSAATEFFHSVVRPKDQALLISFGKSVDLLQDFTASPKMLTAGLRDLRGDGNAPMISGGPVPNVNTGPVGGSLGTPKGTLLFDAIYLVSNDKLKSEVGRKAIILITDGEDEGSTYKLRDAIETAQKSDAIVYSIYYVDRQFYSQFGLSAGGGERDLERISEQTGGRVFKVDKNHTLAQVFKEIQDELRNQYSISYSPTNSQRSGDFRKIEIKVDKPEDKVQARAGYYATTNDAQ